MKREEFKQKLERILEELIKTHDDEKACCDAHVLTLLFLKELGYKEEAELLSKIGLFYG